jgi:lipopolysaccharide exporter
MVISRPIGEQPTQCSNPDEVAVNSDTVELTAIDDSPLQSGLANETSRVASNRKANRSNLKRGIFTLAVGQGGATLLTVLLSPVLTRLYTPEAFGPVTLLTSLTSLLAVFGTWSYYRGIPLTQHTRARQSLVALCFVLIAAMTALIAIILAFFGESLAIIYGQPELASYLVFVPLLFLASALGQVITVALTSQRKHRTVAARTMLDRGGTTLSQVALGATVAPNSPVGLVVGSLIGSALGALWGLRSVLVGTYFGSKYVVRTAPLFAVAKRFRQLPRVYLWSRFISTAGLSAPTVIMGMYFPLEVLGLYAVAHRILKLPSSLFTNSSGQVYYVEAAALAKQGKSCADISLELLRLLANLTAPPVVFLLLFGAPFFGLAFGERWTEAGVYAQILAPWVLVTIIGSPFMSLLSAHERFGEALFYTSSLFLIRVTTIGVGGLFLSARGTLAVYTLGNAVLWGLLLIHVFRLTEVSLYQAGVILIEKASRSLLLLSPGAALCWYFGVGPVTVMATVAGSSWLAWATVRDAR